MPVPHADDAFFHPPPPARTSNATSSNKWGPYSGAGDFGANMAIVLAALFCTVLLALSLGAAVRLFFSRRRSGPSEEPEKPAARPEAAVPATMLFSAAAGTKLAGAGAECAICLTEFAEGDAVQVLPACSHGFHELCIVQWLGARSSCPTCRSSCRVDAGPVEQSQAQATMDAV